MSWGRVSDDFYCHPKVEQLRDENRVETYCAALSTWILMLSRAGQTGPRFNLRAVRRIANFSRLRDARKAADALVNVGLWDAAGDDEYEIHNWKKYQAPGKASGRSGSNMAGTGFEDGPNSARTRSELGSNLVSDVAEPSPDLDPPVPVPVPVPDPVKEEADSPPPSSGPSPSEIIAELAARYPSPKLLAEARESCALTRRNGKMADSVWARTMTQLKASPVEAVEAALRDFVERHADGDKDERYLLGIVRGKAKRGHKPKGIARAATSEEFRGDDPAEFWGEVANG